MSHQYRYGVLVSNHVEDRFGQDLVHREKSDVRPSKTEAQSRFCQENGVPIARETLLESEKPENSTLSPKDILAINNRNYANGAINVVMNQKNYKPSETAQFERTIQGGQGLGMRGTLTEMNSVEKTSKDLTQGGVGANGLAKLKDGRYQDPQLLQEFNAMSQKNREFGEDATVFFGHGLDVSEFQKRDFKSVKQLTMDKKISSNTVINSKYYPDQKRETNPVLEHQKKAPVVGGASSYNETRDYSKPKPYSEFTKTYDASFSQIGLRGNK